MTNIAYPATLASRYGNTLHLLLCLIAAATVSLSLGAHAQRTTLTLSDGSELKVLFFSPESTDSKQTWPLAVMVAGGSGNEVMVRAQFGFGNELRNRGWAIAVPVSPDGQPFADTGENLLPLMMQALQEKHPLLSEKALLVGMSSGGSAALEVGTSIPEYFSGILVVPGQIEATKELADLTELPIFIRIGENDSFQWNKGLPAMAARLKEAGAIVDAELVSGARHVFRLGWEDIDPWLATLQN